MLSSVKGISLKILQYIKEPASKYLPCLLMTKKSLYDMLKKVFIFTERTTPPMNNTNQPRLIVAGILVDKDIAPPMNRLLAERPEVFKHSVNVAYLAAEVCCTSLAEGLNSKFNLTDAQSIEIIKGALLHDIGKLTVPKKTLNKKTKLNEAEIKTIMSHPTAGYEMLVNDKEHNYSKTVLDIVRHHHEKLDGLGYPDGLKKVSPAAQLVAFCDMYDALTETRAYRAKKSIYSAYKIISDEHLDADFFLLLASGLDR